MCGNGFERAKSLFAVTNENDRLNITFLGSPDLLKVMCSIVRFLQCNGLFIYMEPPKS